MPTRLIFDAHLDLAWNAVSFNRDLTLPARRSVIKSSHAPAGAAGRYVPRTITFRTHCSSSRKFPGHE